MKKILLITDVYGWGGHTRAKYIKKYLSNEFEFDIMDADEFNKWDEQEEVPYDEFDLYYFLFHTMLLKKSVKRILRTDSKVMTIVTGFPTLKNIFYNRKDNSDEHAKRTFLNLADRCVSVCANNFKSLEDLRYIYNPRKTWYLPRGVDPKIFYPKTTEFKKRKDTFTVGYVGKPVPEKGLREFIIPACEQASVRIIFNDRNWENALTPEEMNDFYNQMDAYVVASTIDGTPNPALEAASCGKPIISNEIGNMPEFIRDGENGFLLKGEMKINKFANKLRWMKINQKKTFEMGQEARKTIEREWTWDHVVNVNERRVFRRLL